MAPVPSFPVSHCVLVGILPQNTIKCFCKIHSLLMDILLLGEEVQRLERKVSSWDTVLPTMFF